MIYINVCECNICGDQIILRSDEYDYKICKCGKNKIRLNGSILEYQDRDDFGYNFNRIKNKSYVEPHETFGRLGENVLSLIEECKQLGEELDWTIYESTDFTEDEERKYITSVTFEYFEILKNKIETNVYKSKFQTKFMSKDYDFEDDWTNRLTTLKLLMIAQKNKNIDLSYRKKGKSIMEDFNNKTEGHEVYWSVDKEDLGYKDYVINI